MLINSVRGPALSRAPSFSARGLLFDLATGFS